MTHAIAFLQDAVDFSVKPRWSHPNINQVSFCFGKPDAAPAEAIYIVTLFTFNSLWYQNYIDSKYHYSYQETVLTEPDHQISLHFSSA